MRSFCSGLFHFLCLTLLLFQSKTLSSQDIYEILKPRFPANYRKELTRAELDKIQGDIILSDTGIAKKMKNPSNLKKTKVLDPVVARQLDASSYYRKSNATQFGVFNNRIQKFHKTFKEPDTTLAKIFALERSVYDSLEKADKIREKADRTLQIPKKIPLLQEAEQIESAALVSLTKILYTYWIWPAMINFEWLASSDPCHPDAFQPVSRIEKSTLNPPPDSLYRRSRLASSLYSLFRIEESQIDTFNQFLVQKHPDEMNHWLLRHQNLSDSMVSVLEKEWTDYKNNLHSLNQLHNKPLSSITQKDSDDPNRSPKNYKIQLIFKVQIGAARTPIPPKQLKKIYTGKLKIQENLEERWYKYTIGSFSSLAEAKTLRDQISVNGSFITAYMNDRRIKITPSIVE